MTDVATLRQESLKQDSLKHRLTYRAPTVSSARAPKTGTRLTEAQALALLPHRGMNNNNNNNNNNELL